MVPASPREPANHSTTESTITRRVESLRSSKRVTEAFSACSAIFGVFGKCHNSPSFFLPPKPNTQLPALNLTPLPSHKKQQLPF